MGATMCKASAQPAALLLQTCKAEIEPGLATYKARILPYPLYSLSNPFLVFSWNISQD